MKKHGWKGLVSGVVLMALLAALAVPALAMTGKKQMEVDYMDIKLTVDGVPAPVGTPFVSEGTTYLPVRAVGEALYKEVRWDGPTHTIYISDPADPNAVTTGNSVSVDKSKKTIDVDYVDIKLVVDGKEVTPKDVNGKVVEPFAYNGTTYLPVRAVGEALGKTVRWDGETKTVHLGELPQATYLVDVCKPDKWASEVCRAADHEHLTAGNGKRYSQGFIVWGGSRAFELGGKYDSITFDIVLATDDYGEWIDYGGYEFLKVFVDGKLAQTIEVPNDCAAQTVTIPLDHAQVIEFGRTQGSELIGADGGVIVCNAVLNGERAAPEKPVPPANATYLKDVVERDWGGEYEDLFGNKYSNGISLAYGESSSFTLNGVYKTFKATVVSNYSYADSYGTSHNLSKSSVYKFLVDGEVVGEIELSHSVPSKTIEIPLNYGMVFEIRSDYGANSAYFTDMILE